MDKIALLFPGQGSHYIGMGKKFYHEFEEARQTYEEANDILGFDIKNLCFDGKIEELTKTEYFQPAILMTSVAIYRVYMKEIGIEPVYAAGHSFGEFSALTCAGGLKFEDAIRISHEMVRVTKDAVKSGTGAMAAIGGLDLEEIEEECRSISTEDCTVNAAIINSESQIVVSGHKEAVQVLCDKLQTSAKVTQINVYTPFHSPIMEPAAVEWRKELKRYSFNSLKWPVISNANTKLYSSGEDLVELITSQMASPVKWNFIMNFLQKQGVSMAVEIGPQSVLKNLSKINAPGIKAFSMDNEEDLNNLRYRYSYDFRVKTNNCKQQIPNIISRCLAEAAGTRNLNPDSDAYYKGVVQPYERLKLILEEAESNSVLPSIEQMREALELLKKIYDTKLLPINEQKDNIRQIIDGLGMTRHFSGLYTALFSA